LKYTRTDSYTSLATNVSQIIVSSFHGTISLSPSFSNDDFITINATLKASKQFLLDDNFKSSFSADNGIVSLSIAASGNKWWDAINICQDVDVIIVLPAKFFAPPSLQITLTNGDITVNAPGYSFSYVETTTTNGDITLTQINSNGITCTSTNGDLHSTNIIGAGDITFSTTNGDAYYDNFNLADGSSLSVSSTNGDLKTEGTGISCVGSSTISFSTTNGDINLQMLGYIGSFNAYTTNGNADVEGKNVTYTTQKNTAVSGYVYTTSSTPMTAASTNGDVYINFN